MLTCMWITEELVRIAISGETLGSVCTLHDITGHCAAVGVMALEIWPENLPVRAGKTLVHKRLYANRDIEAAQSLLERCRTTVACVAFGAAFDASLTADLALYGQELARAVTVAHSLGAARVNHYCYHLGLHGTPGPEDWDRLRRCYEPALEQAEKLGVTLVLENEAHDFTRDPLVMRRLVEAMDAPCFRTNFDATNYYQAGFEPFPYAYEVLQPYLAYVHIKDGCVFKPEHGHDAACKGGALTGGPFCGECIHYPPAGQGAVNLTGLLARLQADGYDGWCTLEPHTDMAHALSYYRLESAFLWSTGLFTR